MKRELSLPSSLFPILLSLAFTVLLVPGDLAAQYFGQNKVRYEVYDFKTLRTEHFDIYYYDEEADVAREVGRMAERWYSRLSRILAHELPPNQPIVLYANAPAFRATTVLPDLIGEGTGGVTESLRRRVILPVAGPMADTDHVLGHELVHAFQYDIAAGPDLAGAEGLPLWFIEGMAEYLSLGPDDPVTAMWLRDAVGRDDLPELKNLEDPRYFPYRFGQAFWAYVGGTYGDESVGRMLRAASRSGVTSAIRSVVGVSADALFQQWQDALRQQYAPVLRATIPPKEQAQAIVTAKENGGGLNVGPVLSPDGSRMVFFSERDLFSIDLYLADAKTGKVLRKITETAVDPHFDSLQFVSSAGGWSPDGKQFAFGAISSGRPEVAIYDVDENRIVQRKKLSELGEILSISWSPDSRSIALTAIAQGVTDLFSLDLQSGTLKQLTADSFADLQASWSPAGDSLVFVSDRFTSNLETLSFGSYRLALLNMSSGNISPLPAFDEGKHINPEWSSDGRSIYFVSDRDGISNIYRLSVANGALTQVTNLQTGVSGITKLSPAISTASKGNALVYTAFENGDYSLYRIDMPRALAGDPVSSALASLNASVLPPRAPVSREVTSLLRSPRTGLSSSEGFTVQPYKPRLALDYIAPPEVSVGVSNFGSLVGGGTAFSWSDMLGYHRLTTTVQTFFDSSSGSLVNNFAGVATYLNQKSRWDWGLTGGQVPYSTGSFAEFVQNTPNGPVLIDESVQFWQRNREVAGLFFYPINRAQRLEFSTGYQHISFDARSRTQTFSLITGEQIADESEDIPTPGSLNMGIASAALVYDTSIFGGVSPVLGQSYRLQLGASRGSLNYFSFLGDYRRYIRVGGPLVLAGRFMHLGRYGGDSQDQRLQDYFLGNSSLVRGYSSGSFTSAECGQSTGACPVFDQLIGSRLAIANAELRLPLLGVLGVIPSRGFPPVEVAAFYDAGSAWTTNEKASFLGGPRHPVTSFGGTLRMNVLGFMIAQLSYVRPNDRPLKNWMWEFNLNSGF